MFRYMFKCVPYVLQIVIVGRMGVSRVGPVPCEMPHVRIVMLKQIWQVLIYKLLKPRRR